MGIRSAFLFGILVIGAGGIATQLSAQDPVNRIDRLASELSNEDATVRQRAADELAKVGKDAIPALLKVQKEGELDAQIMAKSILDKIEWTPGLDAAKKYASDYYSGEEVNVDFMKMRAILRYFPNRRLIEVRAVKGDGRIVAGTMMDRRGMARGVFISSKYDDKLIPVSTSGIYVPSAVVTLCKEQGVKLTTPEEAANFIQVFSEIHQAATGQQLFGAKLERSQDGWALYDRQTTFTFKVSKEGTLDDVSIVNTRFGDGGQKVVDERERLEIEKLKVELEIQKRTLEALKGKQGQ